ncbi:DUF4446 family protein [Sporomusa acidovorans]|uniref:DUF4446 domain-containing protein n=1 Tax=Sporomusa acidovorans (strain ATCC 49682 / DSM 3132 / Mol) TaxID=1123286 RepID=A0ABZ3JB10_SPOA4|nr:DUF4446 family protein [Sporomusa acidovorans]OZC22671.1 hypothetical protein SPACI_12140 [Sporomusa acidovorans DSM 3132]SDE77651.1 Protein of unknown function [Sporomusa acidovorans]
MDLSQYTLFITANLPYILLGLTVLIFIALLVFISVNIKMSKLNKRYRRMMNGMENANIERLLLSHIEEVRQAVSKVNQLDEKCRQLDAITTKTIQNIGLVRFNAFEDTGSDLSFALALLDKNKNGIVLSSIYGRNESRIYAKPVVDGQSTYHLTEEEKQALKISLEKNS